jgi:hypothetical protein
MSLAGLILLRALSCTPGEVHPASIETIAVTRQSGSLLMSLAAFDA